MDALTTAQKTAVTKFSSDRLRLLLLRYGYAEKVVLGWSREELMNKYAELLAQGIKPPGAVRAVDPEAGKQRMVHKKELKQMETQLEMQKLEQKQRKKEQEQGSRNRNYCMNRRSKDKKIEYKQQLEKQKLVQEKQRLKKEYKLGAF